MNLLPRDRYNRFVVLMLLLVVGLRAWADYDQAILYRSTGAVQALFYHAPADALRFIVNFPVSLISWLLLPAPPYFPWKGTFNFVFRESLSVFAEFFLTLMFWLVVGRLARGRRLACLKRVPLRITLPLIFLIVAIVLEKVGALQYKGITRLGAPQEHPVDAFWARDSFVGYAINAPAWAVWSELPSFVNGLGDRVWESYLRITSRVEPDNRLVEYGFFVAVLWYAVGSLLDKRRANKKEARAETLTWPQRFWWASCLSYGTFLCHMARHSCEGSCFGFDGYAWFPVAVLAWSALLTLGSIHVLCRDGSRFWGAAARVLCAVYTILAIFVSTMFVVNPADYGWFNIAVLAWSAAALTESLYWLLRGGNRKLAPAVKVTG